MNYVYSCSIDSNIDVMPAPIIGTFKSFDILCHFFPLVMWVSTDSANEELWILFQRSVDLRDEVIVVTVN